MVRRKIIYIAILILTGSFLAQCGLERSVTPWGPLTNGQALGGLYTIDTSSDHVSSATRLFWGYLIYYSIRTDSNFPTITKISDLEANGFHRLHNTTDLAGSFGPTVLPVPQPEQTPTSYTITLDFRVIPPTGLPSLDATNILLTSTPFELRRSVSYVGSAYGAEENHFKRFAHCYLGDSDIPAEVLAGKNNGDLLTGLYMAIYVYAYGKSSDLTQTITSELSTIMYSPITLYYDDGIP